MPSARVRRHSVMTGMLQRSAAGLMGVPAFTSVKAAIKSFCVHRDAPDFGAEMAPLRSSQVHSTALMPPPPSSLEGVRIPTLAAVPPPASPCVGLERPREAFVFPGKWPARVRAAGGRSDGSPEVLVRFTVVYFLWFLLLMEMLLLLFELVLVMVVVVLGMEGVGGSFVQFNLGVVKFHYFPPFLAL